MAAGSWNRFLQPWLAQSWLYPESIGANGSRNAAGDAVQNFVPDRWGDECMGGAAHQNWRKYGDPFPTPRIPSVPRIPRIPRIPPESLESHESPEQEPEARTAPLPAAPRTGAPQKAQGAPMGCLCSSPTIEAEKPLFLKEKKQPEARPVAGPTLILVPRGTARACRLADGSLSRDGASATLELSSHPGLAVSVQHQENRKFWGWTYRNSSVGPTSAGLRARRSGDFLVYPRESMVLDVAFASFEAGNTCNWVRSNRAGSTFSYESRRWSFEDDGTIACKSRPDLVLGVGFPRLVLEDMMSPRRVRLQEPLAASNNPRPLLLQNGLAIGKYSEASATYGEWRYTYGIVTGPQDAAIAAADQKIIRSVTGHRHALDISFWSYKKNNNVEWVAGHNDERTLLRNGGRDWNVLADGTIAAAKSDFCIGIDCDWDVAMAVLAAVGGGGGVGASVALTIRTLTGRTFEVDAFLGCTGAALAMRVGQHEEVDPSRVRLMARDGVALSEGETLEAQGVRGGDALDLTMKT